MSPRQIDRISGVLGVWALVIAWFVGIAGCGAPPMPGPYPTPPPIPTPRPTPTPTPVPPIPTPPPNPGPTHVVTPAEYDAVVVGTTTETDLRALLGAPRSTGEIASGTLAWVYPAKGPAGEDLAAEFWVRSGRVVNKNRL